MKLRPSFCIALNVAFFKTKAYVGRAEVAYTVIIIILFCIMLIFCLSLLVGILHDFQILHTDVQIFQLGSHDVLKIQVY